MEDQAVIKDDRSAAKKVDPAPAVKTEKGRKILEKIKQAYSWKDRYQRPEQEFLGLKHYLPCSR